MSSPSGHRPPNLLRRLAHRLSPGPRSTLERSFRFGRGRRRKGAADPLTQRIGLVQVISHEFRTPLTILRGSLETLRHRRAVASSDAGELLDAMERAVLRLQEMVDVVLGAADELEGDGHTRREVALTELVDSAAASLHPRLRRRLSNEVPRDASLESIEAHLWLAVRCLLDNADKFSPESGNVRVRFRRSEGTAVLSVEDDGPGFPDGFEELAFEPFVQADTTLRRAHAGLGLGLYTARRLVRHLGGEVVVGSRPCGGGRAEVRLPDAA